MGDVKWIKIVTDIFDNRKIKQIEKMPEGDSILIIWFKILCLAGEINDDGRIYFTKEIPFTDEMLANHFNRPLNTVRLALKVFEQFDMVEIINDIICLSSWEKYQNVEGLEKIREQNRIRKQNQRERQRLLPESHVTCHVKVTQGHATDIDKEEDIDKEIEIDTYKEVAVTKEPRIKKIKYAEFVSMTEEEYSKLISEHGETLVKRMIEVLDNYKGSSGKKYKSDYRTILNWVIERVNKEGKHGTDTSKSRSKDDGIGISL